MLGADDDPRLIQQNALRILAASYRGPLPPAGELRRYDETLPGLAERIVASWEGETQHRRSLEREAKKAGSAVLPQYLAPKILKPFITSDLESLQFIPYVTPSGGYAKGLDAELIVEICEDAFGADVDYAMLQKIYGEDPQPQKRYSPAKIKGCTVDVVQGCPDPDHVSTSYVERANLTMRMSMRRFTRLTNAFSKKVENTAHAVALHFMSYNFVKPHGTLTKRHEGTPTTPAMEAGVATKPWTYEDVIGLLGSN